MTLTEAAFWTKRFGVIVLGFLGILFVIVFIAFNPFKTVQPPEKYITPTCSCTDTKEEFLESVLTIPSLELLPESNPAYVIQTASGTLEYGVDAVNVYKYTDLGQPIDSQAQAKILAKKLGFEPDRIVRRGTSAYLWYDGNTKRSLNINARDLNFSFTTDASKIREIRKNNDLPSRNEANSLAINALRSLGILDQAYTDTQPLAYEIEINPDGSYSQADSLGNAELIRVDFYRKVPMVSIRKDYVNAERMIRALTKEDLTYEIGSVTTDDGRIEVYNFDRLVTYQNPSKSNISVYIGPRNEDAQILPNVYQIDYTTWDLEPESCGTYPLISPAIAEEKIKNGEGSIVFINYGDDEVQEYTPQDVKIFTITDVTLTYYEGLVEQLYLQPVYLYSGTAELSNSQRVDFFIYYPAISYDSVTDKVEVEEPEIKKDSGLLSF